MTGALSVSDLSQPKLVQPTLPYEVCVYRTRTGEVVDWIPLRSAPRWERGLNMAGFWSAFPTLDSRMISKVQLNGLIEPWFWSWAVVQGSKIHQAGPVIGEDYSAWENGTTISGLGLWGLLRDKRKLLNANRTAVDIIKDVDADVAFGPGPTSDKGGPIPASHQNLSLHTIAKRLVENELAKPGGTLPIDFPGDIAGTAVRTYQGPELINTGDALFDLTQVIGGPEIEFVHRFTDDTRTAIRHQMLIGNFRLGQLGYPHAWATGKAVTRLGFSRSGARMTNRDWARGEGFDRNVVTGFAENTLGVTTGTLQNRPLLESTDQQHSSSGNVTELSAYAAANVASGQTADLVLQVEVTMNGDTGDGSPAPSPAFSAVSPGDTGILWVKDHPRLPDGMLEIRVIRMASGTSHTRGELQVEVLSGGF